jgi:hypothetical protein
MKRLSRLQLNRSASEGFELKQREASRFLPHDTNLNNIYLYSSMTGSVSLDVSPVSYYLSQNTVVLTKRLGVVSVPEVYFLDNYMKNPSDATECVNKQIAETG